MVQPIRKTFDEMLAELLDRTVDARGPASRLLERWRYDIRRPDDEDTENSPPPIVDMIRVLATLLEYRPVVSIPEYKTRRVATVQEGEWVTGKSNRHGTLIGLKSNKATFSFSAVINDVNVIQADGTIGAPRTFMLQDMDGTWYEEWSDFKIRPAGLDPEILAAIGSPTLSFKHFIHPSRWPSFYGAPHLLAHVAAEVRLKDELSFWGKWVKRVKVTLAIEPKPYAKRTKVGAAEKIDVQAFECKVDGAELSGEYPARFTESAEGLAQCKEYCKRLRWIQNTLRVYIRATQFAFYRSALTSRIPAEGLLDWLKGGREDLQPALAGWLAGKTWQTGYKETDKARTFWARMELRSGLALRFRVWSKSEEVRAVESAAPSFDDDDDTDD